MRGRCALHHNIGVPGNSFDGLRTSEVHGRPRESVHRVRMLTAELPYAVTERLRRQGRTNDRDEKRDSGKTSHDVSVAGSKFAPARICRRRLGQS